MKQNEKVYSLVIAIIVFAMISLFLATELVDERMRTFLISENGPIETASATGYLIVLIIMLAKGGWGYLKSHIYIFILVASMGLRELDFDKRFTRMGIFKSKFYLSPEVPCSEKICGFLVIAALLWCIYLLLKKHFRSFLTGCLKKVVPMSAGISVLFIIMSKSIDGLSRKLSSLGINTTHQVSAIAESIEEILELGIPLMILVSTIAFFSTDKNNNQLDKGV